MRDGYMPNLRRHIAVLFFRIYKPIMNGIEAVYDGKFSAYGGVIRKGKSPAPGWIIFFTNLIYKFDNLVTIL